MMKLFLESSTTGQALVAVIQAVAFEPNIPEEFAVTVKAELLSAAATVACDLVEPMMPDATLGDTITPEHGVHILLFATIKSFMDKKPALSTRGERQLDEALGNLKAVIVAKREGRTRDRVVYFPVGINSDEASPLLANELADEFTAKVIGQLETTTDSVMFSTAVHCLWNSLGRHLLGSGYHVAKLKKDLTWHADDLRKLGKL
jgi:hypothetical protein